MRTSISLEYESAGSELIEDISKTSQISLGVGAAVCQRCGKHLQEGERVAVYAFRRCPHAVWIAGQTRCTDHAPALDSLASLGVRELVVTGRVGHCTDHARQEAWPVLLAPEIHAVSPRDSTHATELPGVTLDDVMDCPIAHETFERAPAHTPLEALE